MTRLTPFLDDQRQLGHRNDAAINSTNHEVMSCSILYPLLLIGVDPVSLLRYERVVMTVAAVRRLEEKLG